MRNEPNFRKTKNEPNPLYNNGLWKKIESFDDAKTNPNEPKTNPIYGEQAKRVEPSKPIKANFTPIYGG